MPKYSQMKDAMSCEFATVSTDRLYSKERKLTPAERTAKLLAHKPRGYFNCVISPKSLPGDSAMARARAAI